MSETRALVPSTRRFWSDFLKESSSSKGVFGINVYTESLLEVCKVDFCVDDYSDQEFFRGVPIVRSSDIPEDAIVVVAVGGKLISAMALMEKMRIRHESYFSLLKLGVPGLRDVVFNENFIEAYAKNIVEFEWIRGELADAESRTIFDKLIGFRRSLDVNLLEGFSEKQDVQYFEPFLPLNGAETSFVDVGCFDGSTSLEFASRYPGYEKIYAFEPDAENFQVCCEQLATARDVELFQIGLGEKRQQLKFEGNGSESRVCEDGTQTVSIAPLDSVISHTPSMIKIDVEGGELSVLRGCRKAIEEGKTSFAVAVYHGTSDIWRIPRYVTEVNSGYDIRIRHYTESIYETVMFFTPIGE